MPESISRNTFICRKFYNCWEVSDVCEVIPKRTGDDTKKDS